MNYSLDCSIPICLGYGREEIRPSPGDAVAGQALLQGQVEAVRPRENPENCARERTQRRKAQAA